MANFTQLNLNNPQKSDKKIKNIFATEKALFGAGVLAIATISGVLLLVTNGCSKGSSRAAVVNSEPASPITPSAIVPSAAPVATVVPPAATPKPAKKRVQRKAPMATYTESAYGVSFRYPKGYLLKTGDEPQRDLAGLGPVQTDFVQPGAITVAALELPRASYPGTDFTSGFFSVSVNSEISQQQCEQFAFPKMEQAEKQPGAVSKVKIAGTEYNMVEDIGDKTSPHAKYFHRFENGNCYEFGMGLNTIDENIAGLKPVNRSLVFGRLEQILASVKLQKVEIPEVAKAPETTKEAPVQPAVESSKQ